MSINRISDGKYLKILTLKKKYVELYLFTFYRHLSNSVSTDFAIEIALNRVCLLIKRDAIYKCCSNPSDCASYLFIANNLYLFLKSELFANSSSILLFLQ